MDILSDFYDYKHDLDAARKCIKKVVANTDKFYLEENQSGTLNDALNVLDDLFETNNDHITRVSREYYSAYKEKP